MDSKNYTDYQILKTIGNDSNLSQRLISKQTGINLSSINFALKRLIKKGYVKITNMNKKRILYHLTPNGLAQKGKLAANCFLHSYHMFADVRDIISQYVKDPELKGKKLAIFGVNEITEIVYLCIKNNGIYFSGIFEDDIDLVGKKWLDRVVQSVDLLRDGDHTDFVVNTKSFSSKGTLSLNIHTPDDYFRSLKKEETERTKNSRKKTQINLRIEGAADTVTGSSIVLNSGGKKIVVDCGLFQGSREEAKKRNSGFAFDAKEIDYMLLTHAHIDHSGRIPQLIDQGFTGEILCHHATVDIFQLLLKDMFALNKDIRYKTGQKRLTDSIVGQSWGFEYDRWNQISKGIRFRLLDAGHILGSATIQLDVNDEIVVFSGDIGKKRTGIIKDPISPDYADILILESTYGGRNHQKEDKRSRFKHIIKKALSDNGKVLIPAFAVGRTQEIIYQLNDLVEKGEISDIPVFVDTPLGIKITEIYQKHMECFDKETLNRLKADDDPLDFDKLFGVERHTDSVRIDELNGPAIIIAGSGMCTGGRILNHLVNLLEDKTTDMVFVGYQASGTPGADILKYSDKKNGYVVISGQKVDIRATIHQISGFSAHADQDELMDWVEGIANKPHTIVLNHGEHEAQLELKKALQARFADISVMTGLEMGK